MTDREAFEAWCASMGFLPTQARFETWQAALSHERNKAQQERKPMNEYDISELMRSGAYMDGPTEFIRAIEAFHGIKETP